MLVSLVHRMLLPARGGFRGVVRPLIQACQHEKRDMHLQLILILQILPSLGGAEVSYDVRMHTQSIQDRYVSHVSKAAITPAQTVVASILFFPTLHYHTITKYLCTARNARYANNMPK